MAVETPIRATRRAGVASRPSRRTVHFEVPVLCAADDGLAAFLARRLGKLHPTLVFVAVMLTGLAGAAALSIGLGLLVTQVVEPAAGIGAADERVNLWLAAHRTAARTHASLVGSIIAGGVVLPIVSASVALVAAALRRWRIAAFVLFSLGVESATYRATTLVVHAHRPRVARLESLPVNASYPSGHTAAAIAVYCGLALLATSNVANSTFRVLAWTAGAGMVAFVAAARMYRGMHHPLDIAGGVAVGVAALFVVLVACRASGAAAERRLGA